MKWTIGNIISAIGLILGIVVPITMSINRFENNIISMSSDLSIIAEAVKENKDAYLRLQSSIDEISTDIDKLEVRLLKLEIERAQEGQKSLAEKYKNH